MDGSGRRRPLAGLGAAVAWAAAAACAAEPATGGKPVRSMAEVRNEQVVRQHWDLTCGAAAIATLLTYELGHPVSERDVVSAMLRRASPALVRARLGFSLLDLKIYAATRGFAAAGYGGMTLDDLDAAAPAIVPITWLGFRHFVVYRGRQGGRVLIADPSFGNRTLSEAAFKASWAGGVGFVVFDPGQPHPPNRMGAPAGLFLAPAGQAQRAVAADATAPRITTIQFGSMP